MPSFTLVSGPISITPSGALRRSGDTIDTVVRALAQGQAKLLLLSTVSGISVLTGTGGGVADVTSHVFKAAITATLVAATGSNLADQATTDAALVTVRNAISEVLTKANTLAAKLGVLQITNSTGGTTTGTIPTVTQTVTAAATGSAFASYILSMAALNTAIYNTTNLINALCVAVGAKPVALASGVGVVTGTGTVYPLWTDSILATIPATPVVTTPASGTASVLATDAIAALVRMANNIATLASALSIIQTSPTYAPVLVQ